MTSIQYSSDLHLEFGCDDFSQIIEPVADILILAGDIGYPHEQIYKDFLIWCKEKFEEVILVPGNHEYYGRSINSVGKKLDKLDGTTGMKLLDNSLMAFCSEEIIVIGSTLWSEIPPEHTQEVLYSISDYGRIENFNVSVQNELFNANKNWLRENIQKYRLAFPEFKIIVVTHHAPVLEVTSAEQYRDKSTNCAFASDCTDIMEGVDLWIFGHTHFTTTFTHELPSGKSVIVTANQRGYPHENGTGYKPDRYLIIGEEIIDPEAL